MSNNALVGLHDPAKRLVWWAHLVGAVRVHLHEHYANFPLQKDRGFARGSRELSPRTALRQTPPHRQGSARS